MKRPALPPLSKAAQDARRPLWPPDVCASLLEDRCHKELGKSRPGRSVRSMICPTCHHGRDESNCSDAWHVEHPRLVLEEWQA